MKNQLILYSIVLVVSSAFSQSSETWQWQNYCVGQDVSGAGNDIEAAMADVRYFNGQYYMYYNSKYSNRSAIKYATSPDAINWTVQDTILTGSSDTLNREFDIGGARVVQVGTSQYRLFYRCSPRASSGAPEFHIRSAFSTDGINFTREGVRIEITPYLTNSYFIRAAHSAFYYDTAGTMRAVLTGFDTTMAPGPERMYTATSFDDGLTWSNILPLYEKAHDPVVFYDSISSEYKLYFAVLKEFFKTSSIDGINWPASYDSLFLLRNTDTLTVQSPSFVIGDLGGFQLNNGQTLLYSNFKPDTVIPWSNIVYYTEQNITTNINNESEPMEDIIIYPNPISKGILTMRFGDLNVRKIHVVNIYGQQIFTQQILNSSESVKINLNDCPNGILFIQLETTNGLITRKVVKQ